MSGPAAVAGVVGVGIDAVEIDRFRAMLERRPALRRRLFGEPELAELAARADPVPGLAARFCAKEAVMKALGVGLGAIDLADVTVRRRPGGAPELLVGGRAAALASERGVTGWHVSLTHTERIAEAVVVASAWPPPPGPSPPPSPPPRRACGRAAAPGGA